MLFILLSLLILAIFIFRRFQSSFWPLITCVLLISQIKPVRCQTAQPAIIDVMPASPNAASIAKFGQVPVSQFTGLPQISIPLVDVSLGKIKFPIGLNFHASGSKVEEVSSWVGMGWGLSTGGVITRQIRGIADEDNNAYFNPLFTAQQLANYGYSATETPENLYLKDIGRGMGDAQADIFYFNMGNVSGKFIYNQEDKVFYTIPRQDIKIEKVNNANGGFKLTTSTGDVYSFNVLERTSVTPTCTPSVAGTKENISSWYLNQIVSYDKKDTVNFNYEDNTYIYTSLGSETKNFITNMTGTGSGGEYGTGSKILDSYCDQTIRIFEKRIKSISSRNGTVTFNTSGINRCDLNGAQALDNIVVTDTKGIIKKKWKFYTSYFKKAGLSDVCSDPSQSLNYRLRLDSLKEISSKTETVFLKPYKFVYNGTSLPSRMSKGQDYWGYNNGKTSNQTLIPSNVIVTSSGSVSFNGGDRNVDTTYSILGNIKEIVYPTGGSTEYSFENNRIVDSVLSGKIIYKGLTLDISGTTSSDSKFEKQFIINEPPTALNGYNVLGGAYVTVNFGDSGCDDDPLQGATTCAQFILQGITVNKSSGVLIKSVKDYYPNGTYKLTASFNQNPAKFQDFYFTATWESEQISNKTERLTGGVRLKKMIDYDGISHANDIVQNFTYTREGSATLSSGSINGFPLVNNFIQTNFYDRNYLNRQNYEGGGYIDRILTIMSSYSNQTLVQTGGSYTTYNFVTSSYGNNQQQGKVTYKFLQTPDQIRNVFPYVSISMDWRRGLLLEQSTYTYSNGKFFPIERIKNSYDFGLVSPKFSVGLKTYFDKRTDAGDYDLMRYQIPTYEEYVDESSWIGLTKTSTINYDSIDSTKTFVNNVEYTYSPNHFNVNMKKTTGSDNLNQQIQYTYPQDYPNLSANNKISNAIKYLQSNHINSLPIEIVNQKLNRDGNLLTTQSQYNSYKVDNGVLDTVWLTQLNSGVLNFIMSKTINGSVYKNPLYVPKVSYDTYDNYNNIIQQSVMYGAKTAYKWGYNKQYLIVECKNASSNEFYSEDFEESSVAVTGGAHTGNKYASAATVSWKQPNSRAYAITFWYKKDGIWYFKAEKSYDTKYILTGGDGYDDIRVFPVDAIMTTYTYEPLVGMTSKTDEKGNTVYYEYDGFQRLEFIRDQNRNIISRNQYNYKQ